MDDFTVAATSTTLLDDFAKIPTTAYTIKRLGVRGDPHRSERCVQWHGERRLPRVVPVQAGRFSEYKLGYMHLMIGLSFGFHNKGKTMTIAELKKEFPGPIIANVGFDANSAEKELSEGGAELVAFGRPVLSNPDLVEKMQEGRELRPMLPMEYWYTSKENVWTSEGYTDLSVMDEPVEAKE
ncbi:unnamed protein product [Chondrus crispus]|uniref:NADH:flavin oxidoreductase/NADH oxidase N-terminal domain-containing protein n=1 Tax=Chondrus crispus TaxID=2769 RepID=R7QEB1_CHOCR|nr:unnamed protein product [Chondrus crispus]CDF36852.1 unnamed protein product [Chondrus crispus]|eukprot:XP_005716671.1 unnamed protein product [Chondrus crispus]